MALGICEGCRRFARGSSCPFCGARVAAPKKRKPERRSRNGVLAAAALAIACGGTTAPDGDASSEASSDAPADVREDDSAPVPFYGAAPFDSGTDAKDAETDGDAGGGVPLYGGAPPPDSG
jgi:hypothetical protein